MGVRSLLIWSVTSLFVVASACSAIAEPASECKGRLIYVDDPATVGDSYPLFLKTRRNLYVLRGNCFLLSGSEFRGSITFFMPTRAPEGFSGTYGALVAKSVRTYSIPTQRKKISVSRNADWYLPVTGTVPPIPDVPISTSVTDWNALYTNPKLPEQFDGLDFKWHAYAAEDKLVSSLAWADFWKLDTNDFGMRVATNYLIRFVVNGPQNRAPFYVNTPKEVERIDLWVASNVGSIDTSYSFILK